MGNIDAIQLLSDDQSDGFEHLDIMSFTDQNEKSYLVTVYDSNELWQDPEVMDIYPL